MSERVEKLLVLQNRLLAVQKAQGELDRLPKEKSALEQKIQADADSLEEHRQKSKSIEVERKKLELEADSKRALVGKYKTQQMETRKNEEYQALTHEIDRAEADIVAIEDRELELMEAYDQSKQALGEEEKAYRSTEVANQDRLKAFAEREKNLQSRLEEASEAYKLAEADVDPVDARLFQRILKSKGDVAVVGIRHGICEGCHMRLTKQTIIQAHSAEGLATCENCARILFPAD